MRKSGFLVLAAVLLTLVCPEVFCAQLPFSAKAEDGLVLKGTLYLPEGAKEACPVVLLLPQMANDRKSWGDFPKKLSAAGYAVLAMDQRGHGESVWQGKKKKIYSKFTNSEFAKMVTDLDTAIAVLAKQKKVDVARVAVLGASIGANVAVVYASGHPAVRAVALLSPGLDYRGITTSEAAAAYGDRPALVVAAKSDGYSAHSAGKLAEKMGTSATLKIYAGKEHGTRFFTEEKDFGAFLFDWTVNHFPATSTK
ncbi:MAG: lysophospholipase [candidate division Zixibacteria bacterium]|nr:lysophospholipase [candidate division Zixibacteria bacterium]